jgi:hypothetical protein
MQSVLDLRGHESHGGRFSSAQTPKPRRSMGVAHVQIRSRDREGFRRRRPPASERIASAQRRSRRRRLLLEGTASEVLCRGLTMIAPGGLQGEGGGGRAAAGGRGAESLEGALEGEKLAVEGFGGGFRGGAGRGGGRRQGDGIGGAGAAAWRGGPRHVGGSGVPVRGRAVGEERGGIGGMVWVCKEGGCCGHCGEERGGLGEGGFAQSYKRRGLTRYAGKANIASGWP